MQNLSYENEFDLHENELVGGTRHFHMNGFPRRFVFDREAKGNSEMACLTVVVVIVDLLLVFSKSITC